MSSFDILSRTAPLQRRLFLEASAGTGKTFTIEHIVIRLLLETDYTLDQILVVTFTRAATRELKVRIRANLEKALSQDYSLEQKEKLKTALMTFDQSQIFTIHGFCHRILAEFAFEASISLDLQEWEDKEEKWAALEFLRRAPILSPAQVQRLLGSVRSDIDALINKLLKARENQTKGFSSSELLQQANSNLSRIAPFSVTEAFDLARPHYKGMTSSDFDKQAALLDISLQRQEILPEEWDRLIAEEEIFLEGIEPGNLKARTTFTGHPLLKSLRSAVVPSLEAARNPRHIFQVLSRSWNEERKKLTRLYEKVSPDDLLKMVHEKLTEKSFVDEIRKKYQAVIVDEFQDTDPIQWKIFETLFLADKTKAVYLVGDPKQSIYAFRSADIYTFLEAAKGFAIEEKAALTTNYRSTQGLLDGLNRLFCEKLWMDLPKLNQQLSVPLSTAAKQGEGELCFMIAEGELGMGKRWPSEAIEHQFFSYIIHEIHHHQLRPQEIAILVKDRYQALRVKNALEKVHVPCVISRGASLGDSIMIDLLLELIDACHSTNPLSSVKKVLIGPFVRLPIEELTDEAVFQAKAIFAELSSIWLESGFSVFLAQFLQTKFWKRSVFQTLCSSEVLYDDLMQIVEKMLYLRDPHQMIKSLQLLKIEEVDERISAHPHGVQIMTIHASKGLEFETVFAIGLASRTPAEDKPEDELKELDAEKMRQFYVALTRAKRRLYIPVAQAGKIPKLGEASPVELFLERTSPNLETFTHVYLNQIKFDLLPYAASAPATLVPPLSNHQFFKPFFLQSFTSLAQTSGERKAVADPALPSSAETGIIIHRILERFFDQKLDLRKLIDQEIKSSHLEAYGAAIQTMIDKVLDLQLDGFCLRDLDLSRVMPEMEFLFPSEGTALKGFIDLSFEYNGKFYLIDWKTNALEDYTPESLHKTMVEHDYLLQGKIYATAFTRYLKLNGSRAFGGASSFLSAVPLLTTLFQRCSMFEQLLEQKIFTELDLFFADLHVQMHDRTDNERAFLAALMALSRDGHLCLDLDNPALPEALLKPVLEGAKTAASPYVRRLGNLFYLERNYADETRILNQLKALSFKVKPLDYPVPDQLTDEQQAALNLALSNTLSVIEGGPGTGKTFLTSHLVKAMGPSAQVILAAPTGKAAARLKEFNPQATCGTLHSILGIKSARQLARGNSYVRADLIIIDESSMIDAKLMAFFLGSLEVGQRVVFLGDGNQLPPVETGSLFGDLVDLLPTAHLRQCLRSDRKEVLQLAQDILAGKQVTPHEKLSKEYILQKALENYSQGNQFCILSPIREGPFGVNSLNQEIFELFYRKMDQLLAVPILITRTDYEAGLYNGEVGILWRSREKLLHAEFGSKKIPASALPPYELGYVLSVHKSQGSEFDHVLALVPPGSETFGREVLYTAVTRARHSVVLCGDQETIDKTVSKSSHRRSGLKIRWKDQET